MPRSKEKVAYRLLDTADETDITADEIDGLDYMEQQLAADSEAPHYSRPDKLGTIWNRIWEIRLMRYLILIVTLLLIITFFSQLPNNAENDAPSLPAALEASKSSSYSAQIGSDTYAELSISPSSSVLYEPGANKPPVKPFFNYLNSVIEAHNNGASRDILADDLHFPHSSDLISANKPLTSGTAWWKLGSRDNGKYITVSNYVRAIKSFKISSVTLATQATTEFMYHSLELCKRWEGPISIAVYTPGIEFKIALTLVKFMRQCLPNLLSACIKDRITWHIVYDRDHGPAPESLGFPKAYLDRDSFSLFADQDLCPKYSGPEPSDLIKQFHQDLKQHNNLNQTNYRKQHSLLYPINVPRNVARLAATTQYLVSSDIELYPSENLVQGFISYISKNNVTQLYGCQKYDFTLPIFEVDSSVEPPKTKSELTRLFSEGKAVFFHKYVCDWCQKFPHRDHWLHTDIYGRENYTAGDSELVIFDTTLRDSSMNSWEPIFIGTNEDPLFDDRLTWEGRRDKMGQMYEMCLMGYKQLILGNAFLVHAPGIKHIDKSDVHSRLEYMKHNNVIYDSTMRKLKKDYANSVYINRC